MRSRRLLVFAAASVAVITLLIWGLQPPPTPVYHAVDITIEYRNYIPFWIYTDMANVRALIPTRIEFPTNGNWLVRFSMGLCRVSVGGRSYDSILVMVYTGFYSKFVSDCVSGPDSTRSFYYVLGLFGNNSELGEIFRSYGFPYTYVQASYSYVSEGPVNRTLLSMTYPNGSLPLEVSAITPSATHPRTAYDFYFAYCHLRDSHNFTILHIRETTPAAYMCHWVEEGPGQVNLTIGAGSLIWKALGRVEYVMDITIPWAFPLFQLTGKIGWIEWR